MLTLYRKKGQSIIIGDTIEVTILKIDVCEDCRERSPMVSLGIDAPRSVEIYRKEIHEKILKRKQS